MQIYCENVFYLLCLVGSAAFYSAKSCHENVASTSSDCISSTLSVTYGDISMCKKEKNKYFKLQHFIEENNASGSSLC